MKICLFILLVLASNVCFSKTLVVHSEKKLEKVINLLEARNIPFNVDESKKKVKVYYLLVQDNKLYRNKRLKKITGITLNNHKYFKQRASVRMASIKKKYVDFYNLGIKKKHMRIVRRLKNIPVYTVTYSKSEILTSETFLESFNLSQSSLIFDYQYGNAESKISNIYGSLLTGGAIEGDGLDLKIKVRLEGHEQSYTVLQKANLAEENVQTSKSYLNLDETYFKFSSESYSLTIGKQLFSWGTFDELSFFDRVNIKNSDRFVFDYGEDYRRPMTGIRYQYFLENGKVDFFWDTGLDKGRLPFKDSMWSGVDQSNGKLRGVELSETQQRLFENVNLNVEDRAKQGFGVRYSKTNNLGDFSLNFLKGHSDTVTMRVSDILIDELNSNATTTNGLEEGVIIFFPEETVFGVDYTNAFGFHIVKVEIALIDNFKILNEKFELKKITKSVFSLGEEIEFDSTNARLNWQYTRESLSDVDGWGQDTYQRFFWQFSNRFYYEKLEIGIRQIHFLTDKSFYTNLFLDYSFTDNDRIQFGPHIFTGDELSLFGYHRKDNFLNLKYIRLF
jgi:hypothetical protein